jgi:precorrin-3B C17-methyltransferase
LAKKLYVVSSGAGGVDYLTPQALRAIDECEVVVSYSKYARELEEILKGKELYTSGMTYEIDRCSKAIQYAKDGKTTCIISNGDVNVYGMATLVVELLDEKNLWDEIEYESIAGVTAFLATASKVGACVSQDFAIISLSDKLTDINLISKRVNLALKGDFVLGIYNPKSKKRVKPYINFLKSLEDCEEKIIIIASHIGREDKEKITITNSTKLIKDGIENPLISMSTLLIVGNSTTRLTKNNLVLTPRGYLQKYALDGKLK